MHLKLYCLWLGSAMVLPATTAHADLTALPLEALLSSEVISASRFPQQAREAPSAVSVISAREIREHGWRTLAEALAGVRGVLVADDRAYSYLGPRGLLRPADYNTHVLIMLDGVRLNDNIYTQGPLGAEFPLDMELVERIEYVPGPGASIYGNNAFLGVVNVITRDAIMRPGGEAGIEAGNAGWRRARAGMGGGNGNRDWLLSLSHARRDDGPYSDGLVGHVDRLDGEQNTRLYARFGLGELKLTALLAKRDKADPTAPYDTLIGDARSRISDRHGHLALAWKSEFKAGLTGDFLADYGDYRFQGDYPGDRTAVPADSDLNRDSARGRWLNLQARLTDRRLADHKLVWGAEWQQDLEKRQHSENATTATSYLDSSPSGHLAGLYMQDEWRLNDAWLLNLGARYDHHSSFGGAFNPRLGLIQRVTPRTTLKYLAGTAYRAPNAYELYYDDGGGSQKVNPAGLKPERIRTLEFVAEHETARNWLLTGTLFRYRIRDLITQVVDGGLLMFANQDTLESGGVGLQAERRWDGGGHLRLSVSRLRSRDGQGNRVSLSPDLLAKAAANLPLGGWNLGLECQYVGPRRDNAGGEVAGYSLAHLNLIAPRLADRGELSLRIRNLFDRHYSDPAGDEHTQTAITQAGRSIEARLAWHF
ncbi:MAG: TonB-dependent receptor [Pseudomonadota bacterium]|nr:TonB-dependent receptor [Pseudomonadota bacterium]